MRRRIELNLPGTDLQIECIKGYLLITSTEGMSVLNVTIKGPREVVTEPYTYIAGAFGLPVRFVWISPYLR